MKSYYWIKVRHSLLQEREVATLSDHLWRRNMELNLLAGAYHKDGLLPPLEEMAWELRTSEEDLLEDLEALEERGLTEETEEGWFLPGWSDRQSPTSNADRQRRYRQRQKKKKKQKKEKKETTEEEIRDNRYIDNIPLRNAFNDTITGRNGSHNGTVTKRNGEEETEVPDLSEELGKTGEVMSYFLGKVSGSRLPSKDAPPSVWDQWIPASNTLLDYCGDNVSETLTLIDQTIDYMDEEGLAYSTPGSLVNTARMVQRRRNKTGDKPEDVYAAYKRLREAKVNA